MPRSIVFILAITLSLFCGSSLSKRVSSEDDVGPLQLELQPFLSDLASPVFITGAGDGSNRLFVVEQVGRIKVFQSGSTTASEFLDIRSLVLAGGERGLLGLAFHPNFESNRRFFVNYTRRPDGATVIAEYRASESNANIADTQETLLLQVSQPFSNHNGGMIAFGPDGFLYIGMGDGGSANDPGNRAQDVNDLLGKILRIDVDRQNGGIPYSSPADNPFFGVAGRDEIYAVGVRNPWRFSFDRLTGDLYVGDVGQNAWEEIDIITPGGNYGWRVTEGNHCNPALNGGQCSMFGLTAPIAEYVHSGGRCSITGGYVYRGAKNTFPAGTYLYGDFCTGEIFTLTSGGQSLLLDTGLSISSFGEDESGELYAVGLGGTVHRFVNPQVEPPVPPHISSVVVRRRTTLALLQPIAVRPNGKRFDVVITGEGFVSNSVILVNGIEVTTELRGSGGETRILTGRLKKLMLRVPGLLTVEFVNPDGARSNQVVLEVVAEVN